MFVFCKSVFVQVLNLIRLMGMLAKMMLYNDEESKGGERKDRKKGGEESKGREKRRKDLKRRVEEVALVYNPTLT